jgi:hypothetical protein
MFRADAPRSSPSPIDFPRIVAIPCSALIMSQLFTRLVMPGTHLFPHVTVRPTPLTHPLEGLWPALTYVHQRFCGLTGHDLHLHFERRRLCLECDDCGWQSPGWEIGRQQSRLT